MVFMHKGTGEGHVERIGRDLPVKMHSLSVGTQHSLPAHGRRMESTRPMLLSLAVYKCRSGSVAYAYAWPALSPQIQVIPTRELNEYLYQPRRQHPSGLDGFLKLGLVITRRRHIRAQDCEGRTHAYPRGTQRLGFLVFLVLEHAASSLAITYGSVCATFPHASTIGTGSISSPSSPWLSRQDKGHVSSELRLHTHH